MSDARPPHPEDVERGLRFAHAVETDSRRKLAELQASFYALLEAMVSSGRVSLHEYEAQREKTLPQERERMRREMLPVVTMVGDKYALKVLPDIDCDARLPLCKARCCTLTFALSEQDLDERVVRWDYGRPYQIARRPDGYCVHNEPGTGNCNVYAQRPAVCRQYDCRRDSRIWIDFDKRIAAP